MRDSIALLKVVDVATMHRIEAAADASGLSFASMMENAGRAVAGHVLSLLRDLDSPRVTVLIGPGNNGGDGLVAGRLIAQDNRATVRFYLTRERTVDDPNFRAVREMGLLVASTDQDPDHRVLRNMVASADIVVDALYGIGISLPLRQEAARILRSAHQGLEERMSFPDADVRTLLSVPPYRLRRVRPIVLAVDCPSGLDCDTGAIDANALEADETVTFIAAKPGLFEFPGAALVGKLSISMIGVPTDLPDLQDCDSVVVDDTCVRAILPKRPANANKGTFGRPFIVAGSGAYVGAPGLAALGAYRIGAGLVTVATVRDVIRSLSAHLLEPTWLLLPDCDGAITVDAVLPVLETLRGCDSLLVGPGLGQSALTRRFLLDLLSHLRQDGTDAVPVKLIIDADGLNILSREPDWWTLLPAGTVITPHPGELSRLSGRSTIELMATRRQVAAEFAAAWNVTLVLKGAHTLVAEPGGRLGIIPFKSDALATGGTGDVLAGMIAGLLAQGLQSFEACVSSAYLHGLAGIIAAERQGSSRAVMAADVAAAVGEAFARVGC